MIAKEVSTLAEAKLAPWVRNPYGLVSLLDMLKAYAEAWRRIGSFMGAVEAGLKPLGDADDPIALRDFTTLVRTMLEEIKRECSQLDLAASFCRASELHVDLSVTPVQKPISELGRQVGELETTLRHELQARQFLYVSPNQAAYYESQRPFGEKVGDRFPLAQSDIEEGAKCLALGRNTACAFHLMRVCEHGLKAVANTLNIPRQRDWGAYIREINAVIHRKPNLKAVKWPRDTSFYQDITGDIEAIKLAWRNPGIHIERDYKPDEAAQVFAATKVFMERLTSKLPGPKVFR